jgi:hypothetical protein
MPRHTIHLGNAWQAPEAGAAEGWRRRFGRPTGVEPTDRVLLVVDRPAVQVPWRRLELNGLELKPIGDDAPRWECDVTALLQDRNELLLVPGVDERPTSAAPRHAALPPAWGRVSIEVVVPD